MSLWSKHRKQEFFVLLFLVCVVKPAVAGDDAVLSASQGPSDHYQHVAYVDPANYSIIERYALDAGPKFMADPALYLEKKQTGLSSSGVIGDWRERVFKKLSLYSGPRLPDLVNDDRFPSENELDEQANERRTVRKLVVKESLKFTQERVPGIDKLVNALKLEVSNRAYREDARVQEDDKENGETRVVKRDTVKDALSLKTGLRVRVEEGNPGLVSETEARYRTFASFYNVNLDRHNDSSVGLRYVLSRDLHIQVEREVTRATDPLTKEKTNEKSNLNLLQMVYTF